VRIALSYLAANFDWQAHYVADLSEDADRLDLQGWLTIASQDDTIFVDATTRAMAGQAARAEKEEGEAWRDDEEGEDEEERYEVIFHCWPSETTGSAPAGVPVTVVSYDEIRLERARYSEDVLGYGSEDGADIVVTGSRIAAREDVGDLKLYTVPFPVTVPSNSQKQVAFLTKQAVPATLIYRSRVSDDWPGDPVQLIRIENRPNRGIGEPMPGGMVQVFQRVAGQRLLLGEARMEDRAVGEDVELVLAEAANVDADVEEVKEGEGWTRHRLTVSNANPFPIRFEAEFRGDEETRLDRFGAKTFLRRGARVWAVTVPAEGEASIAYRAVDVEAPEEEDYEE
jgi:hypothetical protein